MIQLRPFFYQRYLIQCRLARSALYNEAHIRFFEKYSQPDQGYHQPPENNRPCAGSGHAMIIQELALIPTVLVLLISWARALSVFPGSPCYNTCDGSSPTQQSDIVCTDSDFETTEAGQILSSCLTCLHASNYQNGILTDSTLFICKTSSHSMSLTANTARLLVQHPTVLSREYRCGRFLRIHVSESPLLFLEPGRSQPVPEPVLILFRQRQCVHRLGLSVCDMFTG